ncbi:sensor histidine kinase [Streptomyces swartbergensis]|uniref:histidine kinase n=1 Tax=Streptomyces swartbergensis TaxID=487165 RepID=A0A243S9E0_9ACTN|nr:HAMP domain-containing sensor histidine kinase [Streptomyces swartbergensis]OUD04269.1 two-component sensor histidine kinase [Streptomyces swartbergensis]
MRLSTRMAIAVGVTVPLLVLASGLLLLGLVAKDLHQQQDAQLHDRAAAVTPDAKALLRAAASDRPPSVEHARERRLFAAALDVGVRLTDPAGTVTAGGPQPDASVPLPPNAATPVTVRAADGASWRVLSVPVAVNRPVMDGTLWLFSPDTAKQAQIRLVRGRVVTVAMLAAPLAGAVGWAAAAGAARPLRRLQRRTSGLDPRTSAARLDHTPTGIAEVDDLARTIRTVLERYDQQAARTVEALEVARSFSAAASHELRTPLMSMRTNLDILAEHPDLADPDRAEVLADLRREHTRLLGLLVMLRALAQGDLVEADAFGPVDLAEVVDASVAGLRRGHPDVEVTVTGSPGLWTHGWEQGLRSAVDNLLTNACIHGRFEDRPARIDVALCQEGQAAVLMVDDHGPGIPPERRDVVFQRFHRRPSSPGSGLGLTLVAQQIALHRGTVSAVDRPDGRHGARFVVRLPTTADYTLRPLRGDWLSAPGTSQGFHKEGS